MKITTPLSACSSATARRGLVVLLSMGLLLAVALPGCKKKEETDANTAPQPTNAPPPAPAKKEEPPVEFKAKWPVGKRLLLRTQADLLVTQPGATEPTKLDTHHTNERALSVLAEREGGGVDLELEFLVQKMDNKVGGKQTLLFDTQGDPKGDRTNTAQVSFRKIIGVKIKSQTAVDGKVTKLEGGPLFRSKLTAGASSLNVPLYNQMFSDDSLKSLIELHGGLPDKPVKPGDTWETKRDLPGTGGAFFTASVTNLFKGWAEHDKRNCALFEHTGAVTNKPGPGPLGIVVTVETGTLTGKSWFDPELGIYVDTTLDTEISLKTTSPALPGQAVPTVVKHKIGTKLIELSNLTGREAAPAEAPKPTPAKPAPDK